MNEKVVVLFILGMGAVRLYEDYVDEVDRDDDDEEDRFKKRKISRRDVSDEPIPPANTFETVVEVKQNLLSDRLMKSCDNIGPQNCSCRYEDAVSLPCAHNFCKTCILRHLEEKQTCPACFKPANKSNVQPDAQMRQIICGLRAHPSFCKDCKTHTEKLQRCVDCNNDLCEKCLESHLNNLKQEVKMLFQKRAPERREQLAGYRERLNKIETRVEESTKSSEESLRQHEESLLQKLDKMQHFGSDVESDFTHQLNEAKGLLNRIKDLINESSRGTILDSNEMENLLAEMDN